MGSLLLQAGFFMLAGEGRRFYGYDHSHQKSNSEPVRRTQYHHQQARDDVCAAAIICEEYSVRQKHRPEDPDDQKLCDGLDMTLGEFFSTPEFDALEQEIQ